MTYSTNQGETFTGVSPLEIVTALRDTGRFTADQPIEEFMADFANRMKEWANQSVQYATPEAFVADLERVGYLTKID